MSPQWPNLQRIWVLRHPGDMEQCILSLAEGPEPGFVEDVLPGDYVAAIHFARLGPMTARVYPDGREFGVMPILEGPTKNQSKWAAFPTANEAMLCLEKERDQMIAAGWHQHDFDPVNDPD